MEVSEESERASWGLVEEATVRVQAGVEVPRPRRVLPVPAFGKIASINGPVEVANLESAIPPPPDPQALPVDPTNPEAMLRQPSERLETKSLEVEAVPVMAREVEVALVVVEFKPVKF